MSSFDTCYASILASEGGYVNNPRDPGGITNLGVTKRAWEAWTGRPATVASMKALTPAAAAPFYRAMYWNAIHGDSLPVSVALCLFHCAVNSGPQRAGKILQAVVGATPDGSIGPATLRSVTLWLQRYGEKAMVSAFQDDYRDFYRSLSTFATFGRGWMNRAAEVEAQAKVLAR